MKRYLAMVLCLLPIMGLFAGTVSPQRASNIGQDLFTHLSGSNTRFTAMEPYRSPESMVDDCYILHFEPTGFLILAAEEQSTPVLAYSLEASFPFDAMPAHVQWFISQYSMNLAEIRSSPQCATDPAWNALERHEYADYSYNRDVAPLLSTSWDQDWPYNSMCPLDSDGPGGRVYAGCVATAMGQIMKRWSYPTTGIGTHSYTAPGYGTQAVNYGTTSYNWASMPNIATTVNTYLSTLLYHCSVAVDTQYGPDGSGALSEDVRDAMVSHFRYSTAAVYRTASSYTSAVWTNLLRGDLELGRPIYYGGTNGSAGHSFVMDGYQGTNYFHMNWGWNGNYNGYYYLNNLNPNSYNFNLYQAAVVNIFPLGVIAPDPPTNVVATIAGSYVDIEWDTTGSHARVWRLLPGQETAEANWYRLTPGTISTDYFTDTTWAALPDGTYKWAVKTVNTAGVLSAAAFSNTLTKLTPAITQTIALTAGWNFVSLNVSPTDHSIATLTAGISANVLQVKGMEGVYIPDNPYNTLNSFANGKAYFVKMDAPATWVVSGQPIPTSTTLALTDGWNMVAYLPQSPMATATAVASIAAWVVQVKGTDGVYNPDNPYSTLVSLSPGKGYWIKLSGAHNMIYPAGGKVAVYTAYNASEASLPVLALTSSMTVLAKCEGAEEGDILIAKVNGELRGSEKFITPEGFAAALIQVFTETPGEELEFSILKPSKEELSVSTTLLTQPQGCIGTYPNFYELELKSGEDEPIPTPNKLIGCYPNPFNPSTTISFSVAKDNCPVSIEIYNIKGQRITSLISAVLPKGTHSIIWDGTDAENHNVASGIYFIKMSTDGYNKTLKALLSK